MSSSTTIPRRYGKFGLLRKPTDTSSGGRREFCSAKLAASTPVVHWYAKTRDRWKRVFAFASVVHHHRFSAKSLGNTTCSKALSARNFRTRYGPSGIPVVGGTSAWRRVTSKAQALRARLKIARYGQEATVPSPFCTEIKQARCLNLAFSALSSLFSLASGNFQTGSYSASMLRSTRVGIPTTSIFCPTSPR